MHRGMAVVLRWRMFLRSLRSTIRRWWPFHEKPSGAKPPLRDAEQRIVEQFFARQIEKRIGYTFQNPSLIVTALKHRSYVYAQEQSGIRSNERLEFLGDAVLDLVVSEHLYHNYPQKREGRLTQLRSALVNKVTLASKAEEITLGKYLLLSESEVRAGGRQRGSILSDAFEALIGAIYLDGGLSAARRFIMNAVLNDIEAYDTPHQWMNYKSVLLEYTQSEGKGQPRYRVESEVGPDHEKIFTVEVYIGGAAVGKGSGTSKKDAEQNAARDATERLNLLPMTS